ncbi:MAG: hypothetical protein Q7T81_00735 [Pseudolabrys sp.]|nr:hypothetical protein [Pseudolabrys sp.]
MRLLSLAAVAAAVLVGGPLHAQTPVPETPPAVRQDAAPPEAPARFTFNRVDGGFLRLDSVSGQVASCSQREAGWVCQAVPEDRAALEGEIARLQSEVTQLKSQVAALHPAEATAPRPPADLTPRAEGEAKSGLKLPTDEDIKWARERVQSIWRQFVGMVAEMQKDLGK